MALLFTLTHSSNQNPAYELIDTADTSAVWDQMTLGPRGTYISRKKR